MEEIDAANFTGYFHRLGASFFLGLGKECKQELMHESLAHLIEIRFERDWSLGAQEIEGLTARFFRELSQIIRPQ